MMVSSAAWVFLPRASNVIWDGDMVVAVAWDSMQTLVLTDAPPDFHPTRPHLAGSRFIKRQGYPADVFARRASAFGDVQERSVAQYSNESYDAAVVAALAYLVAGSDRAYDISSAVGAVMSPHEAGPCGPEASLPLSECVRRASSGGPVGFSGFSQAYRSLVGDGLSHTPLRLGSFDGSGVMTMTRRDIPAPPRPACPMDVRSGPGSGDGVLRIGTANVADGMRSEPTGTSARGAPTLTSALAAAYLDLMDAGFPLPLEVEGFELPFDGSLGRLVSDARIDVLVVGTVHWMTAADMVSLSGTGVLATMPVISGGEWDACRPGSTVLPWYDEVNLAVEAIRLASDGGARTVFLVLDDHDVAMAWRRSIASYAAELGVEIVGDIVLSRDRYDDGSVSVQEDMSAVVSTSPDVLLLGGSFVPMFEEWGWAVLEAQGRSPASSP